MSLYLTGIGTAVPPHSIPQPDAARAWAALAGVDEKRARTVQALYRKSRIRKRHSVLLEGSGTGAEVEQTFFLPASSPEDQGPSTEARMQRFEAEAPALGARAAKTAMVEAGTAPEEITHLVTVSCTGFFAPGPDTALIELLGLPPTVERTNVGFMGCHGALNGLRVAASFTGADPGARVLVSSVELCTLHLSYEWDPDLLVANSLFGDGAAAVVGRGTPVGGKEWTLVRSGTCRLPESGDAMSWRIGNHGFRMTLSASVPAIIRAHLRDWVEGWLGRAEPALTMADVKSWAVHPGGPRILGAAADALELPPGANDLSREVLADHGNMSSATILFILDRLRAMDAPRPCVAMAFGPGLVVEAALFL